MSISSILSAGIQGMQTGINRVTIAGTDLGVKNDSFAESMIGMRRSEIDVKAAADVIKTGDEILGTLIDLRA